MRSIQFAVLVVLGMAAVAQAQNVFNTPVIHLLEVTKGERSAVKVRQRGKGGMQLLI